MVIGIDGSRAFIESRTGTENYSFQLLKHLSLIDTENDYLIYLRSKVSEASKESDGSNVFPSRPSSPSNPSTPYKWPSNFHFKVLNYSRLWTQIGLAKATFEDKLDVLFVPSHTLPLIRKPGLKTVITVHDLGAEYLPMMHQLRQVLYLKVMTDIQLKGATKIIAVSKSTKNDIVKRVGINPNKIKVVYEGIDQTIFKKISNDALNYIMKKYDLEREKYFLFVGTIQPRKNLERLITGFSNFLSQIQAVKGQESGSWNLESGNKNRNSKFKIPNSKFKLVLVGQKGWKSDQIYNLPKELGIEDKVLFPGRVSDEDLPALYKGALAFTYPSLFEGFGLPILESFSMGTPVITSNISSMPEIAGDAALLVDPYSEKEIAEAMLKIVQDDKLRDSLVVKGYSRLKDFSWEKAARETLEILKNVASSK